MRRIVPLLIMLLLLGGAGYYFYTHGWSLPGWVKSFTSSSEDEKTSDRVRASLSLSKRVSGYDIGVETSGGTVTLTGQVPSEDVKSFAGEIARDTPGVNDVNNQLAVNPGAQPTTESVHVEDLEIRADILEAIAKSPELAGQKIDVKVEDRTVTLSGTVQTPAQNNGAEQLARSVNGVSGVTNNLSIVNPQAATEPPRATEPPADPNADLAKRVEFELFRTGAFDLSTTTITANDGAVTLSGTVRSIAEKLLAERVAQGTPGVKKVTNELKAASAPARK